MTPAFQCLIGTLKMGFHQLAVVPIDYRFL